MSKVVARLEIYAVDINQTGEWAIKSRLYDPTGSFIPSDVEIGDIIIIRDRDEDGAFTYDQYQIKEITGCDSINLHLIVEVRPNTTQDGISEQPITGAFPIVGLINGIFDNPVSSYLLRFDPDFETAIETINLKVTGTGNSTALLIELGNFTADASPDNPIVGDYIIKTINFKNTGVSFPITVTRSVDSYELVSVDLPADGNLALTLNLPNIDGGHFDITGTDWSDNVFITLSVERIF